MRWSASPRAVASPAACAGDTPGFSRPMAWNIESVKPDGPITGGMESVIHIRVFESGNANVGGITPTIVCIFALILIVWPTMSVRPPKRSCQKP